MTVAYPTRREILDAIDLIAEAQQRGVRFVSSHPVRKGWAACHAFDREDNSPSAAICVDPTANGEYGQYSDQGGSKLNLGFFDLLAKLAPAEFPDWQTAERYLSQKAGLISPKSKQKKKTKSEPKLVCPPVTVIPGEKAIDVVARIKRVTAVSLAVYGGRSNGTACRFPVYGFNGAQCSSFTIWPLQTGIKLKGKFDRGKPAGLFLPHDAEGKFRLPKPGETWLLVEGVKDAARLHAMGYLAVGMNTCKLNRRFAAMFKDVNVVAVPDLDSAGVDNVPGTGVALCGFSASFSHAVLPGEVKAKNGDDVRDIADRDGETVVRTAIKNAQAVESPAETIDHTAVKKSELPEVMLPGNEIKIIHAAGQLGNLLGETGDFYSRGGVPFRSRRDQENGIILQPLKSAAACSDFERVADLVKIKESEEGHSLRRQFALSQRRG